MSNAIRKEVSEEKREEYLKLAQDLAEDCRLIIRREVGGGSLEKSVKRDLSLVTSADIAVERAFRERVHREYPDHGIIGEELPQSNPNPDADFQWIIDPIDGTTEFVHKIPVYGTIIALHHKGKPLVGLIDHSALDVRCSGALGLGVTLGGKRITLKDIESKDEGSERVAISAPANFMRYQGTNEFFIRIVDKYPNLRILHGCYAQTCTIRGAYDAMVEWNV